MYDVIIVGAGPSGAASAICLQQAGKKCLILEKKQKFGEKICGGFLSAGAIKTLQMIGLKPAELLEMGAVPIHSFVYSQNGMTKISTYQADEYGLGLTRHLLDNWLTEYAVRAGAEIQFGEQVKSITKKEHQFEVNDYNASRVIIATGANGLIPQKKCNIFRNQTFGLSAQITGITDLSPENVYFHMIGDNGFDYFWLIPNGRDIWNIGIWFQKVPKDAVSLFWLYKEKIVNPLFRRLVLIRDLKGAYCGNYSLSDQFPFGCYTVGDAGGFNSPTTGAGLRAAITSAIEASNSIINDSSQYTYNY